MNGPTAVKTAVTASMYLDVKVNSLEMQQCRKAGFISFATHRMTS